MPLPVYNDDHEQSSKDLLLQQFSDKPNILALLKSWSESIQEVEDVFYKDLFEQHLYQNMSGIVLDKTANRLNITRGASEPDSELLDKVIGEILSRASDGTPDKIREILQALTLLEDMKIFEHFVGGIFAYGESPNSDYTLTGNEAKYLKNSSPITTGSCVFGVIRGSKSRLFIPSEITFDVKQLTVNDETPTEYNVVSPDGGAGLDNIVVRDEIFGGFSLGDIESDPKIANAILPEISFREEDFLMDTESGEEALLVNTSSGTARFQATVAGIDNSKGILLDTVQVTIPKERDAIT